MNTDTQTLKINSPEELENILRKHLRRETGEEIVVSKHNLFDIGQISFPLVLDYLVGKQYKKERICVLLVREASTLITGSWKYLESLEKLGLKHIISIMAVLPYDFSEVAMSGVRFYGRKSHHQLQVDLCEVFDYNQRELKNLWLQIRTVSAEIVSEERKNNNSDHHIPDLSHRIDELLTLTKKELFS